MIYSQEKHNEHTFNILSFSIKFTEKHKIEEYV